MLRKTILFVSLLLSFQCLLAQQPLNITIISDSPEEGTLLLQTMIKAEIKALLDANYQINFTEFFTNNDIDATRQNIEAVYKANNADVLIGAGLLTSRILSEWGDYPLPTIAAINIDNLFPNNRDSTKVTSSVHNFTYIQSPFNLEMDLEVLTQINNVEQLAILIDPVLHALDYDIKKSFSILKDIDVDFITVEDNPQITLDAIDPSIDAVYVLTPLDDYSPAQSTLLFQGIVEKKLPCLSLFDYPMLDYGAYAAFSSRENLQKIPRRVALNVSKIAEGKDPKDFRVQMESFTNQLLINMESVNKTGVYPNWNVMDNALLVNINKIDTERKITLKSAIAEGLENNLDYRIEQKQTEIAEKDVSLAKSNYLPQLEVATTGLFLDEKTVSNSFGGAADFKWSASADFSQLILSEPALANISIQKLLMESQKKVQKQSELDVVLDVVSAYFNYQQVQSIVELQNENIKVKNQNLNIAINKEKVGYSGKSDVYRWETELASAKVDFNDTEAQLKALQFQLNQILNRPVSEDFIIEESDNSNFITQPFGQGFISLITNEGAFKVFADFLVDEAMNNLPEIQQIELAVKAQERALLSSKRALYTPSLALAANYDLPITVINPSEPAIPGSEGTASNSSWNVALVASFPIFTGGSRKHQKQKSKIELFQIQDQQQDLRNKLELQVRANLEQLKASYRNYRLNGEAAKSAEKNVSIVQDLYNAGQVNVTTLIDAQNAFLGAQINANNSAYQFIIDLFILERSTGEYITLATEKQLGGFMAKFIQFQNK